MSETRRSPREAVSVHLNSVVGLRVRDGRAEQPRHPVAERPQRDGVAGLAVQRQEQLLPDVAGRDLDDVVVRQQVAALRDEEPGAEREQRVRLLVALGARAEPHARVGGEQLRGRLARPSGAIEELLLLLGRQRGLRDGPRHLLVRLDDDDGGLRGREELVGARRPPAGQGERAAGGGNHARGQKHADPGVPGHRWPSYWSGMRALRQPTYRVYAAGRTARAASRRTTRAAGIDTLAVWMLLIDASR
jgi:hypothetical protein